MKLRSLRLSETVGSTELPMMRQPTVKRAKTESGIKKPALKEFTLIFHENQWAEYDDRHEARRMRQTDIDFIDTEDIFDTGEIAGSLEGAENLEAGAFLLGVAQH